MTQSAVGRAQLLRVNPFQGLMIDAAVWRDAHDYHRNQVRLHQLALHGWGIASGLEVTAGTEENSLVVQPGVAVDPAGNFIILTEPYLHQLIAQRAGTVQLLIQYSEVPTGPTQPPGDPFGQPTRIVEAFRVLQRDDSPGEPRLELCRVDFNPAAGAVAAAADPGHPATNEIDLRHRTSVPTASSVAAIMQIGASSPADAVGLSPLTAAINRVVNGAVTVATAGGGDGVLAVAAPPVSLVIARHSGQGWDNHSTGLHFLAREMAGAGRTLDVREAALTDVDRADVLYLTGHSRLDLGPSETDVLTRVLSRGGTLVGDGCAGGPRGDAGAREFAHSFSDLVGKLGRRLQSIDRSHPLLTSRYVFSGPPGGVRSNAVVLADGGCIYCDADYGCAWAGGTGDKPLPRAAIRDATEFGVNVALFHPEG